MKTNRIAAIACLLAAAAACGGPNYIEMTKKAHLAECPNYSIGKIVNGYFDTTSWTAYHTDQDDVKRVTGSGQIMVIGAYTEAELEFLYQVSTGEAEMTTVRFNGKDQPRPFAEALIANMCEKARE